MSNHSVENHLQIDLAKYDSEIRRLVPHYDEMQDEGFNILFNLVSPDSSVLDLGCGSGRFAESLLTRIPSTNVTALDVDPKSIAYAKVRLKRFGDRISFLEGSFEKTLPSANIIVAALSLHHVMQIEKKSQIYKNIFHAIPRGGFF